MNLRFKLLLTTIHVAILFVSVMVSPVLGQSDDTSSRRVSSRRIQPKEAIKLTDQENVVNSAVAVSQSSSAGNSDMPADPTPAEDTSSNPLPIDSITDSITDSPATSNMATVRPADFVSDAGPSINTWKPVSASEPVIEVELDSSKAMKLRKALTPIVAPEQLGPAPAIVGSDPVNELDTASEPDLDVENTETPRIASSMVLSPLKSVKPSIKQIPILADPEQFRVTDSHAKRKWFTLQDDQASSSDVAQDSILDNQSAENRAQGLAADDDEFRLLKRLPVADLNQGIASNSMQRAVNRPDVPNPNLSFVASADLAPAMADNYIPATKTWQSPDMVHRPLYFEEPNLERYGNGIGRLQPLKSGVHFFGSMLFLPYKMGTTSPKECDYSMGHYRPGDCVPAYRHPVNLNAKGMLYEGLALGTFFSL